RARQRGALRGAPGKRPRALAAARARSLAPPAAPPRLRAPAGGGAPPLLRPPRRRRARPGTDDRLPRRLLVDGRREGDLVEGGGADAARDRAAAAAPLPLHLLLVGRHAALHPRPQPPRALRGAGGPRARRGRVLPGWRHRLRDAARGGAGLPEGR